MEKEYVCIVCPRSCNVTLIDKNGNLEVYGNQCKRGEVYVKNEYTNPKRMLTTTVSIDHAYYKRLPVISKDFIPKDCLLLCLELLYKMQIQSPIKRGDIIIKNILNTGVDIIASRNLK